MTTSLLRRTVDPLVLAGAATVVLAVAAHGQIIVTSSVDPDMRSELQSARHSPDIIRFENNNTLPAVDKNLSEQLRRAKESLPVGSLNYLVPGHGGK